LTPQIAGLCHACGYTGIAYFGRDASLAWKHSKHRKRDTTDLQKVRKWHGSCRQTSKGRVPPIGSGLQVYTVQPRRRDTDVNRGIIGLKQSDVTFLF
jgi:hypothetical protein